MIVEIAGHQFLIEVGEHKLPNIPYPFMVRLESVECFATFGEAEKLKSKFVEKLKEKEGGE